MNTITAWITRQLTALRSLVKRTSTRETISQVRPERDFVQERETARSGQMSAEDQGWEAETRARDRESRTGQSEKRDS
jgi:hypothetical protein